MIESDTDLLHHLQALEIELHHPKARRDVDRLRALLHADFVEFGYSGNAYAKADILARLPLRAGPTVIAADHFELRRLSPAVALLTYRSAHVLPDGRPERHSLRASIWEHADSAWQLRFHQGTPSASADS
jgi:hypothetical protein